MSTRYLVGLDDQRIGVFRAVQTPRSPRRVAWALLVVLLAMAVGMALVPWQQTAYGDGGVVAFSPSERQQRIDATVDGWVEEWFVQEGSTVAEGAAIARIGDNDPNLLSSLEAERKAVEARVAAAETAQDTAQRNVRRQLSLTNQGLSSRKQYEEAQLKEADVLKELTAARAEAARLQTRLARQGRQLVTAPRAGIILRRSAGAGSVFVKTGDMLALLVPETTSRAVELWLDGNDLPLVEAGREVRLQFEGWPAVQFSGWPSVAVGTFRGVVATVDVAGSNRAGQFRILVVPPEGERWPRSGILRQGVQAHGWVLLDTVPLGYEMWRRFNNFPPVSRASTAETWFDEPTGSAPKGGAKPAKSEGKSSGAEGDKGK